MSDYNGKFSVTFDRELNQYVGPDQKVVQRHLTYRKNTWKDWHLIPSSKPTIVPPEKKTNYIEINAASSSIDLSDEVTGYPTYNDREGSMEFYLDPDAGIESEYLYTDIKNFMYGQYCKVWLGDDPWHYWYGVITKIEYSNPADGSAVTFTISYRLQPYRYNKYATTDDGAKNWNPWDMGHSVAYDDTKWDHYNGVVYVTKKLIDITPINGVQTQIQLSGLVGAMPLIPTVKITGVSKENSVKVFYRNNYLKIKTNTEILYKTDDRFENGYISVNGNYYWYNCVFYDPVPFQEVPYDDQNMTITLLGKGDMTNVRVNIYFRGGCL